VQEGRSVPSRFVTLFTFMALWFFASIAGAAQDRSLAAPPYRHAYYLFLADPPVACEACYVPLLLTVAPLEEVVKDPAGQDCVWITTYERDSIWQVNGIVHVASGDIAAAPRTVRVRKRNYRYQEIAATEVLKLFENPLGTIPISRPMLHSDLPPGPSLEDLKAAFRPVK
jgi:hypothetical protein